MSENSESLVQPTSNSTPVPNPSIVLNKKNNVGRKITSSKHTLGKTAFRLPIAFDRALRLASVLLEEAGEEIHTPQQMVERAVAVYIDYLQNKKHLNFQGIELPKVIPSTKTSY